MVALSEKLCCQGKSPQCGRRRQFAQSEKSPVRCTADMLSARCRRDKCGARSNTEKTVISRVISCMLKIMDKKRSIRFMQSAQRVRRLNTRTGMSNMA